MVGVGVDQPVEAVGHCVDLGAGDRLGLEQKSQIGLSWNVRLPRFVGGVYRVFALRNSWRTICMTSSLVKEWSPLGGCVR